MKEQSQQILLTADVKRAIPHSHFIEEKTAQEISAETCMSVVQIQRILKQYSVDQHRILVPRYGYNSLAGIVPIFDENPTEISFAGKNVPYYTSELEQLNAGFGFRYDRFPVVDIAGLFLVIKKKKPKAVEPRPANPEPESIDLEAMKPQNNKYLETSNLLDRVTKNGGATDDTGPVH